MRKDVKFGLVIGGLLLAVLVVYVLMVPPEGASDVAIEDQEFESVESLPDPVLVEAEPRHEALVVGPADDAGRAAEPASARTDAAVAQLPAAPRVTQTPTPAASRDWGTLLERGGMPLMAAPSAPANNANTNESSDRADLPAAPAPSAPATGAGSERSAVDGPTVGGTPAVSGQTPRTHTVKSNETLSSIAAQYYGAASYYPHILRANPSVDPNRMRPGIVLNIPDRAVVVSRDNPDAGSTASSSSNAPLSSTQYRVVSGDTLERISRKLYGNAARWEEIYELNRQTIGSNPARLKIGQVLQLPAAASAQ